MFFCLVLDRYRPFFGVEENIADNELFRSNCRKPDEAVRKTGASPQAISYQKPPVKTKIIKKKNLTNNNLLLNVIK